MKKLLLFALTFAIPSFMFGQVTTYGEKAIEAGTAAVKAGSAITRGVTMGTTKMLEQFPLNTAPITAITREIPNTGAMYTGMNMGTIAHIQPSAKTIQPVTMPDVRRIQQSPGFSRVHTLIRNNTVDLAKRQNANWLLRDLRKDGVSDKETYLYYVPNQYWWREIKLSPSQLETANKFYVDLLNREDAFADFGKFKDSLGAVTGLAYTGNAITDRTLLQFAMKAPEKYTFLTDFVVLPILRNHNQPEMIKDLANYRKLQEKWAENRQGNTLPLYQTLQRYNVEFADILPENVKSDETFPVNLQQKSVEEFRHAFGLNNTLWKMQKHLNQDENILSTWAESYRKFFLEKNN